MRLRLSRRAQGDLEAVRDYSVAHFGVARDPLSRCDRTGVSTVGVLFVGEPTCRTGRSTPRTRAVTRGWRTCGVLALADWGLPGGRADYRAGGVRGASEGGLSVGLTLLVNWLRSPTSHYSVTRSPAHG